MGCGNILPSRHRMAVKPAAEGGCEDVHSAIQQTMLWRVSEDTKPKKM